VGFGRAARLLAELDGWPHLYSVAEGRRAPSLTPGNFMVDAIAAPDRRQVVYVANTGADPDGGDRRHLFAFRSTRRAGRDHVGRSRGMPAVTGDGSTVVFVAAGAKSPPRAVVSLAGGAFGGSPKRDPPTFRREPRRSEGRLPLGGRVGDPRPGLRNPGRSGEAAALLFIGGPPRQMLLGWHYMDYYSCAYAMNQYLASRGYVAMTVNYRLGVGYGRAFQHPEHGGPAGAAEYQDVPAAGKYLASLPEVDGSRVGVWGGSYGGLLTALGLARNSDLFKAGVDFHGVHDWSRTVARQYGAYFRRRQLRYEKGEI
jgi:dipeptidyl aminopeptidase/acylaminoacyl peptidase